MEFRGIDVSSLQEDVFWNEVEKSGIHFAMIRATYGTSGIDNFFYSNMLGLSQTNIFVGAYHHCYAMSTDEAKVEANHFLEVVSPYTFYYPLALVIEQVSIFSLGKACVTDIIKSFTDVLYENNYYPLVYLSFYALRRFVQLDRISNLDIWLSDSSDFILHTKNVTMRQYSQDGKISGIIGGVNLNTSFENYPEAIKRLGMNNTTNGSDVGVNRGPGTMPALENDSFYTVEKDDSLWKIAQKLLGDGERYREIIALNGLDNETIYPGQTLRIPKNLDSDYLLYRVKRGDTLWEISQRFLGNGTKYTDIMRLNGLTNDMIYAGQILRVPVDRENITLTYIVRPGDTLWGISQRLLGDGSRYTDIMSLNELANDKIKIGQKLKIPSK